jgi:hypothetical protein
MYIPSPPDAPPTEVIETAVSPVELEVNRRNTRRFIAADPIFIVLSVGERIRQPGGGYRRVKVGERPQQRFKLIMVSPAGGSIDQLTSDGTERRVDFVLLGEYDAQVAVGDWWDDARGNRYEVLSLIPSNGYEVRANVSATGKVLDGG